VKPVVTGPAATALRVTCHAHHLALVLYGLLGWLIPSVPWLIAHLTFIPALLVVWRVNAGTCPLNNLESFLTTGSWRSAANPEEGAFIRMSVERYLKFRITQELTDRITYGLMALVWGLSWLHLAMLSA